MIDDFSELKAMKYSGRGITIGMTLEGINADIIRNYIRNQGR